MLENVEKIIKTPFRAFSMNFTFDSLYQSMSSNLGRLEGFKPITGYNRSIVKPSGYKRSIVKPPPLYSFNCETFALIVLTGCF